MPSSGAKINPKGLKGQKMVYLCTVSKASSMKNTKPMNITLIGASAMEKVCIG